MRDDLKQRVTECEGRIRQLNRRLYLVSGLAVILVAALVVSCASTAQFPQSLRVAELIVVDSNGTARVRIGGDLPDAVIDGKTVPRGEKAAGVLLYDGTGQERGGYVTWEPSGNVGLTLDTRKGQSALFVADPEVGTALQMWHSNDLIEMRSDDDGSRLTAVRGGFVAMQEPQIESLGEDACATYRDALLNYSQEDVLAACRRRFIESACQACLSER